MNNKEKLYLAKVARNPIQPNSDELDVGTGAVSAILPALTGNPLRGAASVGGKFLKDKLVSKAIPRPEADGNAPDAYPFGVPRQPVDGGPRDVMEGFPAGQFADPVEAKPAPQTATVNAHPTADKPFYPGGLSYPWLNKNAPAVTNFTNKYMKGKPVADLLTPFKPLGKAIGTVGTGLQSATNMASKMFNNK